jgi:hypothetical protein
VFWTPPLTPSCKYAVGVLVDREHQSLGYEIPIMLLH